MSGKIREIIHNDLKLSIIKLGRYEKINSSLIPELKNKLKKIEEEKILEYKEKLIQENSTLKSKLNSNIEKTNEERKELE